jgi:hypothetical protein
MSPQRQDEKLIKVYEILPEGIEVIDKTETEGFQLIKNKETFQRLEILEVTDQIVEKITNLEINENKKEEILEEISKLKDKLGI